MHEFSLLTYAVESQCRGLWNVPLTSLQSVLCQVFKGSRRHNISLKPCNLPDNCINNCRLLLESLPQRGFIPVLHTRPCCRDLIRLLSTKLMYSAITSGSSIRHDLKQSCLFLSHVLGGAGDIPDPCPITATMSGALR